MNHDLIKAITSIAIAAVIVGFLGFAVGWGVGKYDGWEDLDVGAPVIVIEVDRESEDYIDQMARVTKYREEGWKVIDESGSSSETIWIILKKKE